VRRDLLERSAPSFARSVDFADEGDERWIVVRLAGGITIAANLGDADVSVQADGAVVVSTDPAVTQGADRLVLPGRSAAVVAAAQ
jgi:hypothetical protein